LQNLSHFFNEGNERHKLPQCCLVTLRHCVLHLAVLAFLQRREQLLSAVFLQFLAQTVTGACTHWSWHTSVVALAHFFIIFTAFTPSHFP
jgi:hypothetical protein